MMGSACQCVNVDSSNDSDLGQEVWRKGGWNIFLYRCWRMTGSACQCVNVESPSDSDLGQEVWRKGGWNIFLDRCWRIPPFMYIYIRKSSFFESQKQSQNKLFLRRKKNFFQSQKSSQKSFKKSHFLVTFQILFSYFLMFKILHESLKPYKTNVNQAFLSLKNGLKKCCF